ARSPTVPAFVRPRSGTTDREEVEGPGEIGLGATGEAEVGRRECRDEALVEGLRQAQRGVDPVPAGPQGELVEAELAGGEGPEELGPRGGGVERLSVLGGRVLAAVLGVVGALGPGGRQGEAVRGRDVGDRRRPGEALAERAGLGYVLDRLQEDDRVTRALEAL